MKQSFFLAFALMISLASCNQDEELLPSTPISGVYESADFNPGLALWFVNSFTFFQDGSYELARTAREIQNGTDLGFMYHETGSYVLRGEEFRVTPSTFIARESGSDELYVPKSSLVPAQGFVPTETKGTLRMLDQGQKIALLFECKDMELSLSICLGEQIYNLVRE
jgi:hypothetical protein